MDHVPAPANWRHSKEAQTTAVMLYFWASFLLVLTVISLYSAWYPPSIPNCSLVSYGFAAICGWQVCILFDYYIILVAAQGKWLGKLVSWVVLSLVLFFLYTTYVSWHAVFALFPHPNVFERFPNIPIPLYIPTLVYIPGTIVALLLGTKCVLRTQGVVSLKMGLWERNEQRKCELEEKHGQQTVPVENEIVQPLANQVFFAVDWVRLVQRRIGMSILCVLLPIWFFMVIPFRSFSTFSTIPLAWQMWMTITAIFIGGWVYRLVVRLKTGYTIHKHGLVFHSLFSSQLLAWSSIAKIVLSEDILILQTQEKLPWKIVMGDIRKRAHFWQTLQPYLPLGVTFLNEDGWYYLRKMLNNCEPAFTNFLTQYQAVWGDETQQAKKHKRKKNSPSAQQGRS